MSKPDNQEDEKFLDRVESKSSPTSSQEQDKKEKKYQNIAYFATLGVVAAVDITSSLLFGTIPGTALAGQALEASTIFQNFRNNLSKTKVGRGISKVAEILTSRPVKRFLALGLAAAGVAGVSGVSAGIVPAAVSIGAVATIAAKNSYTLHRAHTLRKKSTSLYSIHASQEITKSLEKSFTASEQASISSLFPEGKSKEPTQPSKFKSYVRKILLADESKPPSFLKSFAMTVGDNAAALTLAFTQLNFVSVVGVGGMGLWRESRENYNLSKFIHRTAEDNGALAEQVGFSDRLSVNELRKIKRQQQIKKELMKEATKYKMGNPNISPEEFKSFLQEAKEKLEERTPQEKKHSPVLSYVKSFAQMFNPFAKAPRGILSVEHEKVKTEILETLKQDTKDITTPQIQRAQDLKPQLNVNGAEIRDTLQRSPTRVSFVPKLSTSSIAARRHQGGPGASAGG